MVRMGERIAITEGMEEWFRAGNKSLEAEWLYEMSGWISSNRSIKHVKLNGVVWSGVRKGFSLQSVWDFFFIIKLFSIISIRPCSDYSSGFQILIWKIRITSHNFPIDAILQDWVPPTCKCTKDLPLILRTQFMDYYETSLQTSSRKTASAPLYSWAICLHFHKKAFYSLSTFSSHQNIFKQIHNCIMQFF